MNHSYMKLFKNIGACWIIHIFAVLHAVLALGCRAFGYSDEMVLTLLTMTMVVVLCLKKDAVIEFFAVSIIVVNVMGYLLGMMGAELLSRLMSSEMAVHSVSTFITTEVLGWSVSWMSRFFTKKDGKNTSNYVRYILLAALFILFIRIVIVSVFANRYVSSVELLGAIQAVFNNIVAIVVLACLDILYIMYVQKWYRNWPGILKALLLMAFLAACSAAETLLIGTRAQFYIFFVVSLMLHISVFCIIYLIYYAQASKSEMLAAREKANQAQYRYLKLKRQLNPHFLFNTLNILDCLICEEKNAQASLYTHKLASVYRYLIKSEEKELVMLEEELAFVDSYVELLKVRFPEGFSVETDVDEKYASRMVLPCSVQLLIENATKHNAVLPSNPLRISIFVEGDYLVVRNNIVPKVSLAESTGLGHKYIRQQYLDLSGKNVEIFSEGGYYCVKLPLL